MRVHSIRLRNIRSYVDQTITFGDGSVLLAGDIGAGKSSVLLGIEFALFGIQRGALDGAHLLRNGADKGSVTLEIELDGKRVIIERNLKRARAGVQSDNGHIEVEGARTIGTTIELKSRILELLGYPREALTRSKHLIYRYTVYTPQEEMRRILSEDAQARLQTLRTIFGIDRYRRAQENAQILAKSLREERSTFQALSEGLEDDVRRAADIAGKLSEAKTRFEKTTSRLRELRPAIESVEKELAAIEQKRAQLAEARQKAAGLQSTITHGEATLTTITTELQRARENHARLIAQNSNLPPPTATDPAAQETYEKALIALRTAEERNAATARHITTLTAQEKREQASALERAKHLAELEKRLATLTAEIAAAEKDWFDEEILAKEMERAQKERAQAQAAIQTHAKRIETLADNATCPVCGQPINEAHRLELREESKKYITAAEEKATVSEKAITSARATIEAARKIGIRIASLRATRDALTAEAETLRARAPIDEEIARIRAERTEAQKHIIPLEPLAAALKSASERAHKEKERARTDEQRGQLAERISESNAAIERAKKQLTEQEAATAAARTAFAAIARALGPLSEAEKEAPALQARKSILADEEKKLLIEQSSLHAQSSALEENAQALATTITSKQEARAKSEHRAALNRWITSTAIPSFGLMERQVLAQVYHEFNAYFTAWLGQLLEDETVRARLDADFAPVIEQNGHETPVESLSGGEKTACALAYRLALTKVINDLIPSIRTKDFIILDEPTEGFSSAQLDRVRDVLHALSISQVILVSHEQKIESFVDSIVRVHKEGHESRVS